MAEQTAFDFDSQDEDLQRISSRIGRAILEFCRAHRSFHADELRRYVISETGIAAPASADRILRDLRQKKRLDYIVRSRAESSYEVRWVRD